MFLQLKKLKKKPISKLDISWIGDSNNVLNSLIAASVKFNFKLNIGCPKNYHPQKNILNWAKRYNKRIDVFNDAKKAAANSDVIFSDKVISLNDKVNKKKNYLNSKILKLLPNL